jgi:YebC/PmpR family DNA-binding regulatory protein
VRTSSAICEAQASRFITSVQSCSRAVVAQRYKMLRIVRRLAGHSKWANIRHKKGGKDAAKADQFQKLAKVIETSSKLAGGDRSHPALASALSRAKDARMPKKTVDAAVSRGGADKAAGAGLEEMIYEGTLPGGVGVIVDALSDNKNRTAGEVRATFKKHGGALGAPGSVAWNWSRVAELRPTAPEGGFDEEARDRLFEAAVEAGADDVVDDCVESTSASGAPPRYRAGRVDGVEDDATIQHERAVKF